eukprot:15464609-Alexandrium_andersonii.AAC.1
MASVQQPTPPLMSRFAMVPNFITNTVVFVDLGAVEVPLALAANVHLGIRVCDLPCDRVPDDFHQWCRGSSEVTLAP